MIADQLRAICQTEADKKARSRTIIAKRRAEITRTIDNFVQTAANRYASTGHGEEIQRGLDGAIHNVSDRWQMMFDLLDRKAIAEFDLYKFLAAQQFRNGKVFFQNSNDSQTYHHLSATADDARKRLHEFSKQLLENNPNLVHQ